jgi:hypothetical protein
MSRGLEAAVYVVFSVSIDTVYKRTSIAPFLPLSSHKFLTKCLTGDDVWVPPPPWKCLRHTHTTPDHTEEKSENATGLVTHTWTIASPAIDFHDVTTYVTASASY